MTDREHELLNRFLDGELAEADQSEFERCLRENPELAEMRDDFAAIGSMLREHVGNEAEAIDFSGFVEGIDARIGVEEPAPTAAYDSEPVTTVQAPVTEEESFFDRMQGWWRQNWSPLALGAAAAAAVIFFVMRPADNVAVPASDVGVNVVVDSISNEGKKMVLVSMPAQQDESTVIWLLDDEEEEQGPEEGEDPI